jgi:diguanylate cyclase (GGDEF)-like protein
VPDPEQQSVTAPRAWIHRVDDPFDGVDRVCYESDTAWAILPATVGMIAAYTGFAVLHRVIYGQSPGPVMVVALVVSLGVMVAIAVAAWRHRIPDGAAHGVMALIVGLTTVDATIHLVLTDDPRETMGFLFLLVGVGIALLRRAWFVPTVCGIWVCWVTAILMVGGGWTTWGTWVFYMVVATVLGISVMALRRRSIDVASAALRQAMRAATEDTATRLANRRGLEMRSRELVALARRRGEIVHCTFLDVDGLKAINDERGHDAGDRVIVAVAQAIRATCRSSDVVARWGGDEFVVVGLGPSATSHRLEERVGEYFAECHADDEVLAGLRISVGRAELAPWEEGDIESLLWKADHDMYQRRAQRPRSGRTVFLPDGVGPFEV